MQVILDAYKGQYAENKNIRKFYANFQNMTNNAVEAIRSKLGLNPPPITFIVRLVDGGTPELPMGEIPMFTPTGLCEVHQLDNSDVAYFPELLHSGTGDNIRVVSMSSLAVAKEYHGYTSAQKVLTHEFVHGYFNYYSSACRFMPLWVTEGIALWTANQTWEEDFKKVPHKYRNGRWGDYLSYIQQFQKDVDTRGIRVIVNEILAKDEILSLFSSVFG